MEIRLAELGFECDRLLFFERIKERRRLRLKMKNKNKLRRIRENGKWKYCYKKRRTSA